MPFMTMLVVPGGCAANGIPLSRRVIPLRTAHGINLGKQITVNGKQTLKNSNSSTVFMFGLQVSCSGDMQICFLKSVSLFINRRFANLKLKLRRQYVTQEMSNFHQGPTNSCKSLQPLKITSSIVTINLIGIYDPEDDKTYVLLIPERREKVKSSCSSTEKRECSFNAGRST